MLTKTVPAVLYDAHSHCCITKLFFISALVYGHDGCLRVSRAKTFDLIPGSSGHSHETLLLIRSSSIRCPNSNIFSVQSNTS